MGSSRLLTESSISGSVPLVGDLVKIELRMSSMISLEAISVLTVAALAGTGEKVGGDVVTLFFEDL